MGYRELEEACRPYWRAEAHVVRAYFDGPRTPESDCRWILRQAHKEYWDGFAAQHARITLGHPDVDGAIALARAMVEELEHFQGFTALHEAFGGGPISPERARAARWDANDRLMALRATHQAEDPYLGGRAFWFTEGGHMELYREGMRLRGRGGRDDAIALVCARVYEDEAEHMGHGARALDLDAAGWERFGAMVLAQLEHRVVMRWEQFDEPLPWTDVQSLFGSSSE